MQQKNTPSPSSEFDDFDEMPYLIEEDVDEIIDPNVAIANNIELESENDEDSMEGDSSEKAICVFRGHLYGSVFCGSLSRNGKLATTGSEEDKAYIWDTATGNVVLECTGHKDSVIFTEFNHNETYVATADMSGLIQLWQMSDKVCVWDYDMGDVLWLKWHHSAINVLLAGSVDGEVYIWKVPEGQCKVFQGYGERAESGTIFPDGNRLVVGYRDGAIRVMDLKENKVLSTIPPNLGHHALVTAIDCHADNNLLISASIDGKTILSTAYNGKVICVLQSFECEPLECNDSVDEEQAKEGQQARCNNWVETLAFCKDPAFPVAATGTVNGELFIWDISKQILRHKVDLVPETGICKVLWKGNTSIIFAAGLDGVLRCVDAKTGDCLRMFKGHSGQILDLYISGDEKKALTVSDDTTARVFDISSIC